MIEYSLLSGLTAFVFINLLCKPNEVFEWWPKLIALSLFGRVEVDGYNGRKRIIKPVDVDQMTYIELAIYKPLAGCAKCCAGWISVAVYLMCYEIEPLPFVFFVIGAIFTAWVLTALKEKYSLES